MQRDQIVAGRELNEDRGRTPGTAFPGLLQLVAACVIVRAREFPWRHCCCFCAFATGGTHTRRTIAQEEGCQCSIANAGFAPAIGRRFSRAGHSGLTYQAGLCLPARLLLAWSPYQMLGSGAVTSGSICAVGNDDDCRVWGRRDPPNFRSGL
jgi:hypothetical protein